MACVHLAMTDRGEYFVYIQRSGSATVAYGSLVGLLGSPACPWACEPLRNRTQKTGNKLTQSNPGDTLKGFAGQDIGNLPLGLALSCG